MVKASLGTEAVILSTREVSNGLFKSKEIEVTAALPSSPSQSAQPAKQTASPASRQTPFQTYAGPSTKGASPNAVVAEPKNFSAQAFEQMSTRVEPLREELSDELNRMRSAMEDMRREMRAVTGQVKLERELALPPTGAECLAALVDRGVDDVLAKDIMARAMELAQNTSQATVLAAVRQALGERILAAPASWVPEGDRRIIALVGPTGVGKTTTLAKLAARAIMDFRQKVALITVDTYRIGASEQVMRYGEIMSVPTFVARDRIELTQAIDKCAQADLVLIDSAGRSVSEAVARQAEMLRSIANVELHLVLSACTGPREMAAAADRYRPLAPERLVVTKIDEAVGPGSLVTAAIRVGRPIVAITDGQRVPEDIHALSVAELTELVLGDFSLKKSGLGVKVGGR